MQRIFKKHTKFNKTLKNILLSLEWNLHFLLSYTIDPYPHKGKKLNYF